MTSKVCAVALFLRNKEVLLGKRTPLRTMRANVWDLIGGHCEGNETAEQTLLREVKEELGVTPTEFTRVATLKESASETYEEYTYLIYLVTQWIGFPRNVQPQEHTEIRWFSINEALQLDLALPDYPDLFRTMERNHC